MTVIYEQKQERTLLNLLWLHRCAVFVALARMASYGSIACKVLMCRRSCLGAGPLFCKSAVQVLCFGAYVLRQPLCYYKHASTAIEGPHLYDAIVRSRGNERGAGGDGTWSGKHKTQLSGLMSTSVARLFSTLDSLTLWVMS